MATKMKISHSDPVNRLHEAQRNRQDILNALRDGPRPAHEIERITKLSKQKTAQYLLRMLNTEVMRTRDGKRPDGKPCFVYQALVSRTVPAKHIGAILAANVNKTRVEPRRVKIKIIKPTRAMPAPRLFGGL